MIGRRHTALAAYEDEFLKRLGGMVSIIELPEGRGKETQRKQQEEKHILNRVGDDFVLFDEQGCPVSSMDWAQRLAQLPGGGCLDFVVGGASGVSDGVRKRAGACWSLSRLTLPHQLVRVLVLEQTYRAVMIHRGHPYHRP